MTRQVDRPPVLAHAEIEKLLSMRLIANLATIDDDGGIHIVPMWFLRVSDDICRGAKLLRLVPV